ncbi:MAG: hypothetical protein KDD50_03065 [Bdellovibrionales bacterium]|nr:hypothetical protein [Bdellovibrionales bacterium]
MKNLFFPTIVISLSFVFHFFCSTAQAYYLFHDTGDLLEENQLRLSLHPQFTSGSNLVGILDTPWGNDSNIRYYLGFGDVSMQIGAQYKWVPYPDYQDQPAIGVSFGPMIARKHGDTEVALKSQTFISKKFSQPFADFNTYAALPLALSFYADQSDFPFQLIIGSNMKTHHLKGIEFSLEGGLNLHASFGYVSLGFIYFIDNKERFLE